MDCGGKGSERRSRGKKRGKVAPSPPHGPKADKASPSGAEADKLSEQDPDFTLSPSQFFAKLSREEKQLLLLREELYEGSWEDMEEDLRRRLERRPFVFRLINRIEEDLRRIKRLRGYEEARGVDLGVFLKSETDDS